MTRESRHLAGLGPCRAGIQASLAQASGGILEASALHKSYLPNSPSRKSAASTGLSEEIRKLAQPWSGCPVGLGFSWTPSFEVGSTCCCNM